MVVDYHFTVYGDDVELGILTNDEEAVAAFKRDHPDWVQFPVEINLPRAARSAPGKSGMRPRGTPGALPPALNRPLSSFETAIARPLTPEQIRAMPSVAEVLAARAAERQARGQAVAPRPLAAGQNGDIIEAQARGGMDAVSAEVIPGIMKASATGTDTAVGGIGVLLGLLFLLTRPPPRSQPPVSGPMMTEQSPPARKEPEMPSLATPELAKPGEATLSDDRRKYILDGDNKGGGGHGPGRGTPKKRGFPSDWSDEKAIQAIEDIANDPASARKTGDGGRTEVEGTRDGVDIRVIIGRDRKAIVTAYPTNIPRNEGR